MTKTPDRTRSDFRRVEDVSRTQNQSVASGSEPVSVSLIGIFGLLLSHDTD